MSTTATAPAPAVKASVGKKSPDFVHCYAHGVAIYYWPMWAIPPLVGLMVYLHLITGNMAAWICMIAIWLVLNTAFDLSRTATIAILAVLFGGVMGLVAAQSTWDIPIFAWLGRQIAAIPFDWSPGVQSVFYGLAAIAFVLWSLEIVDSIADGKWVFSRNEFVHDQWGRRDKSLARGQCTVTVSTPDRFKWLLGLGGARIEIHAAEDNNRVHAVIENVIFGSRKGRHIHELLQATQVVKLESVG